VASDFDIFFVPSCKKISILQKLVNIESVNYIHIYLIKMARRSGQLHKEDLFCSYDTILLFYLFLFSLLILLSYVDSFEGAFLAEYITHIFDFVNRADLIYV
jgi:hypothetical protein